MTNESPRNSISTLISSELPGYEAARDGIAYYPHPEGGLLQISGADRVNFLQRQTTNDLNLLIGDRTIRTVLTTANARVLDVFTLIPRTDSIVTLTLPRRAASTARFLRGKIFFMDDVTVDDLSENYVQIDIDGEQVKKGLLEIGVREIPSTDQVVFPTVGGERVILVSRTGWATDGYRLIGPPRILETVEIGLESVGGAKLTPESLHTLRVEAGLPGPDVELAGDYTPLETGLEGVISSSKGCYTGQEVIARQITYDKVTRKLVGVKLPTLVETGCPIWAAGKNAGVITSVVNSPRHGPIALAVVKRPHNEPGTRLQIRETEDEIEAKVVQLPFMPH